jgi:hypothetical protein
MHVTDITSHHAKIAIDRVSNDPTMCEQGRAQALQSLANYCTSLATAVEESGDRGEQVPAADQPQAEAPEQKRQSKLRRPANNG